MNMPSNTLRHAHVGYDQWIFVSVTMRTLRPAITGNAEGRSPVTEPERGKGKRTDYFLDVALKMLS